MPSELGGENNSDTPQWQCSTPVLSLNICFPWGDLFIQISAYLFPYAPPSYPPLLRSCYKSSSIKTSDDRYLAQFIGISSPYPRFYENCVDASQDRPYLTDTAYIPEAFVSPPSSSSGFFYWLISPTTWRCLHSLATHQRDSGGAHLRFLSVIGKADRLRKAWKLPCRINI